MKVEKSSEPDNIFTNWPALIDLVAQTINDSYFDDEWSGLPENSISKAQAREAATKVLQVIYAASQVLQGRFQP